MTRATLSVLAILCAVLLAAPGCGIFFKRKPPDYLSMGRTQVTTGNTTEAVYWYLFAAGIGQIDGKQLDEYLAHAERDDPANEDICLHIGRAKKRIQSELLEMVKRRSAGTARAEDDHLNSAAKLAKAYYKERCYMGLTKDRSKYKSYRIDAAEDAGTAEEPPVDGGTAEEPAAVDAGTPPAE